MTSPLLALDFDGVLCNGLVEYFQTAWIAYCQIWSPEDTTPPEGLAESFYRLRPVVETGWEMPVVLRSRQQGASEAAILDDWRGLCQQIVTQEGLDRTAIADGVDGVRDAWIERDLEGWLSLHEFYPGVLDRLRQWQNQEIAWAIVTTKEGRFVRSLLEQQGIPLQDGQLFGKEVKRPKHQILREFLADQPDRPIHFLEDRLNTLYSVATQPDLAEIRLYLADWGYNTDAMRAEARQSDRLSLVSLTEFARDFPPNA